MEKFYKFYSITFMLLIIINCDKKDNPVAPNLIDFKYPFNINNKWEYNYSFRYDNMLESQALFTVYRDKNIVLVFLQELNPQFLYEV